jgi:hypothetical protein
MNKPITESITSNVENTEILSEYADIRWQIAALTAKLKEIEPIAIKRAISIIGDGAAANGKRVVYRTDTVDIVLQLRSCKPKPENNPDLESLRESIELEAEKARHRNRGEIAAVELEIAVLQSCLALLQQTDEGRAYQAEYAELERRLTTLEPLLSVKLK